MPIEYMKSRALFRDQASVEEAEDLLEWLQNNSTGKVDLSACSHMHTANLQVLMTARARISAWPKNTELRSWLEPALKAGE